MIISFFEEFPSLKALKKLKLIKSRTKLFIAAHSVKEFYYWKELALSFKPNIQCIYWPVLSKSKGYWISEYASYTSLKKLFNEIESAMKKDKQLYVMLDIEKPILWPWLFVINFFTKNKAARLIENFIHKNRSRLYVCISHLGLSGNHLQYIPKQRCIIMVYTSFWKLPFNKKMEKFKRICNKHKSSIIALGCIAKGIVGFEPLLSSNELKMELKIAKDFGVKHVIIYRLAGVNSSLANIINKFNK